MGGKAKDAALEPGAQENSRPSFVKCPFVDRALRALALLSAAAASESPAVAMGGMGKDAALEPGATGEEMLRELLQPMLAHSLRWRFVCVSVETARLSALSAHCICRLHNSVGYAVALHFDVEADNS
jgi:hypothetical protein